jgi:hypothetical protein
MQEASNFLLLSCSAYFLTLKMEAARSSEMSVNSYQTTRRPKNFHESLKARTLLHLCLCVFKDAVIHLTAICEPIV